MSQAGHLIQNILQNENSRRRNLVGFLWKMLLVEVRLVTPSSTIRTVPYDIFLCIACAFFRCFVYIFESFDGRLDNATVGRVYFLSLDIT